MTAVEFTYEADDEVSTCSCGEPITLHEGVWVHIVNPVLSGADDHRAHP